MERIPKIPTAKKCQWFTHKLYKNMWGNQKKHDVSVQANMTRMSEVLKLVRVTHKLSDNHLHEVWQWLAAITLHWLHHLLRVAIDKQIIITAWLFRQTINQTSMYWVYTPPLWHYKQYFFCREKISLEILFQKRDKRWGTGELNGTCTSCLTMRRPIPLFWYSGSTATSHIVACQHSMKLSLCMMHLL
jgi:hypothetical protein